MILFCIRNQFLLSYTDSSVSATHIPTFGESKEIMKSCLDPEVSGEQDRRGKLGHITHRELAASGQSCEPWGIRKGQRSEEITKLGILQKE